MLFKTVALGGLLAAGHVAAIKLGEINAVLRRSEDLEDVLRRDSGLLATLTQRQDANPADTAPLASLTPASGDASKANLAKWEADTKAACMQTLGNLNGKASNPSGIAVCYNVPFLDNSTGVFQAELRMYNVSAPINPWQSVTAADVSMTLSYLGATVQAMNMTNVKREIGEAQIEARWSDGTLVQRQTITMMTELKTLMYVGKINSNLMGPAMTSEALQPLLVPQIDLAARNPATNEDVTTTLSNKEARFVNGVFAQKAADNAPSNADPTAAAAATSAVFLAAPFVVPGTALAFFPIGLVVTGIWTVFFILSVGLGTFGRIQFRDQYRRRMAAEKARSVRTI
ncbi:hypothetical protein C7974DRAFT_434064 [Boeremia exigua]|uniref:uncharacterized protein n=1 Tax=Boeremia exigua TaxID=749465 RepID=UPI001E8DDBDF|nr:uncharacterized protein C7974DRAFT_434064 [Boeremia exigua]KAH6629535.1 hypothetical protein C7974DRAFT_434064 [Boeremia exigua]